MDARHSWLDAVASAGALAGLIGVALGFRVADPLAGFAIAALIVHIGIDATRDVAARLMDSSDDDVTEAVRAAAKRVPTVQQVSDVRVRWLGRELEIRMVIHLPATTTLAQAHDVAHSVQARVRAEVSDVREVLVEPAPTADSRGVLRKPNAVYG